MQAEFDKGTAQNRERYGDQVYDQYMGGATTAGQKAVGAAQMENAIAVAEGKGDTAQADMLRQQLARANSNNQWYLNELKQKADAGDAGAQRELDEYYELIKLRHPRYLRFLSLSASFRLIILLVHGAVLSQGYHLEPQNTDLVVCRVDRFRYAWQSDEFIVVISPW